MKKLILASVLLLAVCLPARATSDAEAQIIRILQGIYDNGTAGGGGGGSASDVTVHDASITSRFLGINASGQVGISNFPSSFNIGAALPTGSNVIGGVTQSGTWTVQPGNTANTTAWKVDGSAVTQPVSATALPLPSGASTSANQTTEITSLGTIATNTGANHPNVITTATPTNVTATGTSGTVLAANGSRADATIVNYGTVGCFLTRGATAVAGQGIYLAPNGGSYNIDANNLYRGIITGITASSTTTLAISEGQ